jgi:hypothetical protein
MDCEDFVLLRSCDRASLKYSFKYNQQYVTVSVVDFQPNHASGGSKQAWHVPDAVCTVFDLLMMVGETARNM